MTTLHALMIFAALATGSPSHAVSAPSAERNVLAELDARYQRGELTVDQWHLYRVAAIRRPSLLPDDLRQLRGRPVLSGTRVLVEAMQHVIRTGDWGGGLQDLLQPPPDNQYTLDSTDWPIRVSYEEPEQFEYAQEILRTAELSYDVQINEYGFHQPVVEPGYEPYRIYVGATGSGVAGYMAPYDENPATPWSDCFGYIVINPNLGIHGVGHTVAHEVNHSMQVSMDCLELSVFLENTAVYISAMTDPAWYGVSFWYIPYFQAEPWRALDYFANGGVYQYGGVLWLFYLTDRFAPDDGPTFVREIWEASMQNGWYANEPDYYDAIEQVVAARGFDATDMESLYTDFAEARYFVSSNDDGQHIPDAGYYWQAEEALAGHYTSAAMPIVDAEPQDTQRPAPYGSNVVAMDLITGSWRPIRVSFDGADDTRWAARVLLTGPGRTTQSVPLELGEASGQGSVVVQPDEHTRLLLLVVNLGEEDYDPDDKVWPPGSYRYSIAEVIDPPVITGLYPGAVQRGRQNLHLRLTGDRFVYGPEFEIRFGDPLIDVYSIDSVSATEVLFTLTVPASAPVAVHDVTVVNAGGDHTTAAGLLTVVDELHTMDPGPKPGCHTGRTTGGAPLVLLLVLVALLRRRRRR